MMSRMGRIKDKRIAIPEAAIVMCIKHPAFRGIIMGRAMIKRVTKDSEYDMDLEDRVCLEDEYLDCWKDHVGDLGETDGKIDGETAARPNQILNPWRYGGGVRIRHRRC